MDTFNEHLYQSIGVVTVLVIGLATMVGLLWLGLWIIGQLLKVSGYWKMTYKALVMVGKQLASERREKNK